MVSKLFQACNGCEDRHVGCHSSCEKYIEDKAKLDAHNAREQQLKSASKSIDKWDFDKVMFWSSK